MTSPAIRSMGVFPSQRIHQLIRDGAVYADREGIDLAGQVQPASIDLSLGTKAYRLQASFLPQADTVAQRVEELSMYEVDLTQGAILERGAVYLIPLNERLALPAHVRAKANPKSSTGRLDIFTRVITDHCARFEEIVPGYRGGLFMEVVPRSFTVKVRTGQRLNQLRFYDMTDGGMSASIRELEIMSRLEFAQGQELQDLYNQRELLCDGEGRFIGAPDRHLGADGLLMGVNLGGDDDTVIGYKTKKNSKALDLDRIGAYRAEDYWEALHPPRRGRLILEPEEFYIFASKERIRIPLEYASEMVEFDAGTGELRTHYAGFFDPGFGHGAHGEIRGTKAVLEVRPHDVPFIIEDGQILFKMKYEAMTSAPLIHYGAAIGSNYHDQELRLSKLFIKTGAPLPSGAGKI
ncbi:MAG: 2'-deoxycytidine 5'-triphosphate deaminase [Nitrospinae bacterium]|nr:2'-deoxycytidine 5'-triphosphate deaminase [Nitrospinota bacterium]